MKKRNLYQNDLYTVHLFLCIMWWLTANHLRLSFQPLAVNPFAVFTESSLLSALPPQKGWASQIPEQTELMGWAPSHTHTHRHTLPRGGGCAAWGDPVFPEGLQLLTLWPEHRQSKYHGPISSHLDRGAPGGAGPHLHPSLISSSKSRPDTPRMYLLMK